MEEPIVAEATAVNSANHQVAHSVLSMQDVRDRFRCYFVDVFFLNEDGP